MLIFRVSGYTGIKKFPRGADLSHGHFAQDVYLKLLVIWCPATTRRQFLKQVVYGEREAIPLGIVLGFSRLREFPLPDQGDSLIGIELVYLNVICIGGTLGNAWIVAGKVMLEVNRSQARLNSR